MPKEYVQPTPDSSAVRVGWSDHSVQVATVANDGLLLAPTPEGNGWFVDLGRDDLNRLIRVLRRARDRAFGSDE